MIQYENLSKLNAPFKQEFESAFAAILDKGWFILGEEVKKFEQSFAAYCKTDHCIGLANGLDALIIALKALNLPEGSEVIVPSNTYIATILSIVQCGLKPVLVEPDIRTYNIDPLKIGEKITGNTSCIMVVHLYGKLCDMKAIMEIANRHSLKVVEDCAQAHGASFEGKPAGSWGQINAFSFYPTKNLGALGDAGGITTDDAVLADFARTYRNYGSKVKYHNEIAGVNSRLDEIQAAFLNIKLKKLDAINEHKRMLADLYFQHIRQDRGFILPDRNPAFHDVFHIFNIRHEKRNELKEYLLKMDIGTDIHYPIAPVNQPAMKDILGDINAPIAAAIHETTLSLPVSYCHSADDIMKVIEAINKF